MDTRPSEATQTPSSKRVATSCGHCIAENTQLIDSVCPQCNKQVEFVTKPIAILNEAKVDLQDIVLMTLFYEPVATPCGHVFENESIRKSLLRHPGCPICREPVTALTAPLTLIQAMAREAKMAKPELEQHCSRAIIAATICNQTEDESFIRLVRENNLEVDLSAAYLTRARAKLAGKIILPAELAVAGQDCLLALRYDPANAMAIAVYAAILIEAGDYESAITECNKALAINPALGEAFSQRAMAKLMLNQEAELVSDINKALDQGYIHPHFYHYFLNLYEQNVDENFKQRFLRYLPDHYLVLLGIFCYETNKYNEACEALDKAIGAGSSIPAAYVARAQALLELGINRIASEDLDLALLMNPHYVMGYYFRARLRFKNGEFHAAIADLNKAHNLAGRDMASILLLRGSAKIKAKDYVGATLDFDKVMEIPAQNITAFELRSQERLTKKDWEPDEVNHIDAQIYAQALIQRSIAKAYRGSIDDALVDASSALGVVPHSARALCNRAWVLVTDERYEDALLDLNDILDHQEYFPALVERANVYYNLERYDEGIADATRVIVHEENHLAYVARAACYSAKLDYAKTLADLNRSIAIKDDNILAYVLRGKTHLVNGSPQCAIPDFDKVISIHPTTPDIFLMRGQAKADLGQYVGAVLDYTHALEQSPNNGSILLRRGEALLYLNENDSALADLTRILDAIPSSKSALIMRALFWFRKKEFAKAQIDIDAVLQIDPNNGEALRIREQIQQRQQVQDHLKNSARLFKRKAEEIGEPVAEELKVARELEVEKEESIDPPVIDETGTDQPVVERTQSDGKGDDSESDQDSLPVSLSF